MFGTLVIQLPSMFLGGAITVQHGLESNTSDLPSYSGDTIKYIAFYADCIHQLPQVTSGARSLSGLRLTPTTWQRPCSFQSLHRRGELNSTTRIVSAITSVMSVVHVALLWIRSRGGTICSFRHSWQREIQLVAPCFKFSIC
jgi:hypothetical protein